MYIDFDPMDDDKSLGKYLKSIREEKEISIDELAETTRINKKYLAAIESDNFDNLPRGPYLNLFLKSYTETLEIDYDTVKSYLETVIAETPPKPIKSKPGQLKPVRDLKRQEPKTHKHRENAETAAEENSWNAGETKKYLTIVGAFAFLAFIVLICIIIFSRSTEEKKNQNEPAVYSEEATAIPAQEIAQDARIVFLEKYNQLSLTIYPASQQAINVISDGKMQSKLVSPLKKWHLVAQDSLLVSCERKDKTKFYINGFLVRSDLLDFTGENNITIDKTNWIDFVDTLETE